jgi:pimeloyl-ACP methyl ester carboxylesterase
MAKHLTDDLGPKAADFADFWREKQLEYSLRRALMRMIAPDYIGFGYSDAPDVADYTFDNLATHVEELLFGVLGLKQFSIYVQDYSAPVGYRIASEHPEAIEGIVVQNGNAYLEGIGGAFDPMKPFWANRNMETEKPVRGLLTLETTAFQYTHGAKPETD